MDVPSPSVATAIADTFDQAARDVGWADVGLAAARATVVDDWRGQAASAALAAIDAIDRQTTEVQAALRSTAASWYGLANRLHAVELAQRAVDATSAGMALVTVANVVQAGLDPATDAAEAGVLAARQAAVRAAKAAFDRAVAEVVEVCTSRRAALVAVRKVVLWGASSIGVQVAKDVAGAWYVTGDVGWGTAFPPSLVWALTPSRITRAQTLWGVTVDPLLPMKVPASFTTPGRYLAAVRAADDWAADCTAAGLVGIGDAPGGGALLTVIGGDVAARTGLVTGRAYTADELPPSAGDVAELLAEIGVHAEGTVTVVLH